MSVLVQGDRLSQISSHQITSHRSGHAPSDDPDTEKEELDDTDSEGKPPEISLEEAVTKIFFITLWMLLQSALIESFALELLGYFLQQYHVTGSVYDHIQGAFPLRRNC